MAKTLRKLICLLLSSALILPPGAWAQAPEGVASDVAPQEAAAQITPDLQKQKQEADQKAAVLQRQADAMLSSNANLLRRTQANSAKSMQTRSMAMPLGQKSRPIIFKPLPVRPPVTEAEAQQMIAAGKAMQSQGARDIQNGQALNVSAANLNRDAQQLAVAGAQLAAQAQALEATAKVMDALARYFGPGYTAMAKQLRKKASAAQAQADQLAKRAADARAAAQNDLAQARNLISQGQLLISQGQSQVNQGNAALAALARKKGSRIAVGREIDPEAAARAKAERLKQLVELLKSFSDEDYQAALRRSGVDASGKPELSSRSEALKTGYTTLAALEYHQAAKHAPQDGGDQYAKAYTRLLDADRASVAIDPDTMQETGRGWEILKMAAKVALKVGITAAIMAAGQEIKSPEEAELDERISRGEGALADGGAAPEKKAELHYQLGAAYEQAAGSLEPEKPRLLSDDKRARLGQLARLLQSISDDDYQGAIGQVVAQIPTKGTRPPLATRLGAVQATYTSMAALEYGKAARLAPAETAAGYSAAYQRAADQEAGALGVDPQSLQQTGWAVDLLKFLGNAAINYELNGGQVFVGRELKSPEISRLDKSIADDEKELAGAPLAPEKEGEVRYRLGAAYEALAAAAAVPAAVPEPREERPAQKDAPPVKDAAPAAPPPPAEPPAPAEPKAPKAQAAPEEDPLRREMREIDDMGKKMSDEVRRRQSGAAAAP